MKSINIRSMKQMLEEIKFGLLQTSGTPFLKLSRSLVIETLRVTDDGAIWCTSPDSLPPAFVSGKYFGVKLKYIQKGAGLFIKVTGKARVINPSFNSGALAKNVEGKQQNVLLLKVIIEEGHQYKKTSVSGYTSFLQAVNNFTFRILPGTKA
jgi:hypothetical protein